VARTSLVSKVAIALLFTTSSLGCSASVGSADDGAPADGARPTSGDPASGPSGATSGRPGGGSGGRPVAKVTFVMKAVK